MTLEAAKKHATTLALVLLAIGLGVWLFARRDDVSEGELRRRETSAFRAWRREELSRIEIAREGDALRDPRGGETIVLERDAKKDAPWRMISPRADRCDQTAVERLLTTLEFAQVVRKAGEGGALGFDPPRAFGSVAMGGLVMKFALGGPSPRPEGSSYLRVDGGPPFVITRELTQALLQPSETYRDRTVVPYLSIDLARVEVKHGGTKLTLERTSDRRFRVAELGVLASSDLVERIWGALAEMRAEAFPKDADAERLVASPELVLTLVPKDAGKAPSEIAIGAACPGHPNDVVVLRKTPTPVAACAPRGALETLRGAAPAAFVERRPIPLRADEIEELRLEWLDAAPSPPKTAGAPSAIELARKGTGFHVREPADHDATADETDAATALLSRIASALAISVTKEGSEPFTPVARAKARFGEEEHVVEIGAPTADARVIMRRVSDGARLEVSPGVARRLLPRATSLEPRKLVRRDRRITRVLLRCGAPQEMVDAGEGFRLVDPPGFESDAAIASMADAFARAKVDAWVADAPDDGFGLAASACRVVLGFEGGNDPLTVVFGAEGDGGVFGAIEGSPRVFVAPRSLAQLARDWYVSRAALRVEPSSVERLRVTVDGKPEERADRSALSSLYAEQVVRVGKGAGVSDVGRPEVVVDVKLAEGGPARRIVCSPPSGGRRTCARDGVEATFLVPDGRVAKLLGWTSDAGAPDAEVARDGGPR